MQATAEMRDILGKDSSFVNLTDQERQILKQAILFEIKRREKTDKLEQVREIVPISDWLESEYYLGPNYVKIYDYWKDMIREVFDRDPKKDPIINELIISGSLGAGKSTASIITLLRKFYELSCYKNIYQMFNLMSTTSIVFVYFSLNKYQANLTGFGDMRSFLDSIPYFKECFPRNQKIDSLLLMPENIMVTYGSGSQHSIGMSLLGSILDEANFFKGDSENPTGTSNSSKVSELYANIVNRSKSRFVVEGGVDHSLSILVSSTTHSSSFTEQRMKQAEGDPHTIVRCPTLWEAKPKSYSGNRFWVFRGSNSMEPFVVESVDDISRYRIAEGMRRVENVYEEEENFNSISAEIEKLPENMMLNFLKVPLELKRGFETNLITSLQDIAGVSVAPIGKLFTAAEVYRRSCHNIEHPFVSQVITISTGDNIKIGDYIKRGYDFKDKHKPRYIHIDQSATTDSTGIVSVYVHEIIEEDGVKKPVIATDFMLRIEPPRPPKRIAIYKIRDFVVYLNKMYGLKIGRVSYDIWSSEESRQILGEMGYNVAYLSVDKTDKAYLDLVVLLYENRLRIYDYYYFKRELFNLIHDRDKRKVNHPKKTDSGESGCFLGDTKIKLLNGDNKRIDELVGEENLELYGCRFTGEIVPVVARKVFKSKEVTEYLKIVLDNGEEVKCTLDHLFMLRDGSYKEAQYLTEEDSLMPLYYNYEGKFLPGYERVWDNRSKMWRYTHSLVNEYYESSKTPLGYIVHHFDLNILNNTKHNLKRMKREEHSKTHALLNGLGREWINKIDKDIPIVTIQQAMKLYGGGKVGVERRLEKMKVDMKTNFEKVKDYSDNKLKSIGLSKVIIRKLEKVYNHRVVSKEIVKCDIPIPVYDIEVPETSNFALTAGIFVHNSKDVSDALAGACQGVLTSSYIDSTYYDGIGDFLRANSEDVEMLSQGKAHKDRSIEELIDRDIERELRDMLYEFDLM